MLQSGAAEVALWLRTTGHEMEQGLHILKALYSASHSPIQSGV